VATNLKSSVQLQRIDAGVQGQCRHVRISANCTTDAAKVVEHQLYRIPAFIARCGQIFQTMIASFVTSSYRQFPKDRKAAPKFEQSFFQFLVSPEGKG
jgi:hypothetical protein